MSPFWSRCMSFFFFFPTTFGLLSRLMMTKKGRDWLIQPLDSKECTLPRFGDASCQLYKYLNDFDVILITIPQPLTRKGAPKYLTRMPEGHSRREQVAMYLLFLKRVCLINDFVLVTGDLVTSPQYTAGM